MDQLEQLKKYMEEGSYENAVALLPSVKEKSLKSASDLMLLARAYGKCADFAHADKLFKKAYKIRPSKLLFRDMIEICVECGRTDAAEEYYDKYSDLASGDTFGLSVLKYRIEKKKGTSAKELIVILKEINDYEYTEEWSYELAKAYHKAGMRDECIDELTRIVETFDAESAAAVKSKTLLAYYRGEISAEEITARGKKREAEERESVISPVSEETSDDVDTADGELEDEETENEENAVEEPDEDASDADYLNPEPESLDEDDSEAIAEQEDEPCAKSVEELTIEAEDEIAAEIEDEKAAEERAEEFGFEKPVEKADAVDLFQPKIILGPDDIKESKAKRIIINNQIRVEDVCKNFFRIAGVRHQIFNCLDLAVSERDKLFLCITGEAGTGRTSLATRLVRVLFLMGILKTDNVVRADAGKLENTDSASFKNMLQKYNVLVENAGKLNEESAAVLTEISGDRKSGTIAILEDNSKNINALLRTASGLREIVNNRIHLTKYDTEELLGFAYDICKDEEYYLSQAAADKLKELLESGRMGESRRFSFVMDVMNKAVEEADRRYAPGILKMAAEAAFSEGYSLIITEDDITP